MSKIFVRPLFGVMTVTLGTLFLVSCSSDFTRLTGYRGDSSSFGPSSFGGPSIETASTSPVYSQPLTSVGSSPSLYPVDSSASPLVESSAAPITDSSSLIVDTGTSGASGSPDPFVSSLEPSPASSAPEVSSITESAAPVAEETTVTAVPRARAEPVIDEVQVIDPSTFAEPTPTAAATTAPAAPTAPTTDTSSLIVDTSSTESAVPAVATSTDVPVQTAAVTSSVADGFRWPVEGRVIGKFREETELGANDGIDISVPEGTPIKAVDEGTVVYSGDELSDFGNLILLSHADGWVSAYAHSSENHVKRGDTVSRGQVIALSGKTGKASAPKVHFELRRDSRPVDPLEHLIR